MGGSRRQMLALLGATAAILAGGGALAEPLILTDSLGRRVVPPAPPRRIVPIFASNTELVVAVGAADRIVGVEAFTRFPPEIAHLPQVGGRLGFSVDRVARLAPDLVIVTPARQAVHQLVDPMERLGIPVMVLTHPTVAAVMANLRLVARACGREAAGEAAALRLEARLAAVAAAERPGPPPRAVMVTGRISSGMLLIARPGTYTADAVRLAGAAHALGPQMLAQVSPEAVLRADPDILLFAGTAAARDEVFASPAWSALKARREGWIVTVRRADFLIPGPRVVDGIEALANVLDRRRRTLPA